jgi:uncharacterized repeat protein (TIGR02543 family)
VGENRPDSSVTNSYATGAVTGNADFGGLAGSNFGVITNSYAAGLITGPAGGGGLVGYNEGVGIATNSFWDTETSGRGNSEGGTGLNTSAMKSIGTFTAVSPAWPIIFGWQLFNAPTQVWGIFGTVNSGYPYLLWQASSDPRPLHVVTFNSQDGSAVANGSYVTGGTVVLPAAPTRSGFTFNGWFAAASGGTALVSPHSPPGTGAITLFAQWTSLSAVADTVNGFTFTADSSNPAGGATITAYSGPGGALTVPDTFTFGGVTYPVTIIGDNAFRQMGLTSVTIPNSVTIIGDSAFRDNLLASVVIPNSVTTIGNDAFIGNQLTLATIGNSVTTIGNGAFASNPLLRLLVPASVGGIGIHPQGFCAVPSDLRTVTFDSAGGSAVSRAIACSTLAVPAPVAPTRAGFTLAGWSVAPTGGALFDFASTVTASVTLFAQWTVSPAVISPGASGGLAATGAALPLAVPMGMATLLLAAGGFVLLASRRRAFQGA